MKKKVLKAIEETTDIKPIGRFRKFYETTRVIINYIRLVRYLGKAGKWIHKSSLRRQSMFLKDGMLMNIGPIPPKKIRQEIHKANIKKQKAKDEILARAPNVRIPFPEDPTKCH